jgi:choline dehydrogenase-like flavoprotein
MTYRMSRKDRATIPQVIRHMGDIFFAAGARAVMPPVFGMREMDADTFARTDFAQVPASRIECASQHPLGSARMGIAPGNSVTDRDGATWDVRDLYVADGSIVPTSLGVNPQLAIMTLATRIGWKLRERPLPVA